MMNEKGMEKTSQRSMKKKGCHIFGTRVRFLMLLLITMCLTSVWCNILTFNIAILCMHPHRYSNASITSDDILLVKENGTINGSLVTILDIEQSNNRSVIGTYIKEVIWYTPHEKGWLIVSVAIGAIVAHFPAFWLINILGIRMVFGSMGLLSSIATLLIPSAARSNLKFFLTVRFFQGIAFAANFSVVGSFLDKWTYFKQNGLFISILLAFFQLAPLITMPIGGHMCANYEWSFIYYGHGIVSFFIFTIFIVIYRNSPNKHPFVEKSEFEKIARGKDQMSKSERRAVPYKRILKSIPVWVIWISAVAFFFYENLLFSYAPTYLHTVLQFQVNDSGFSAAAPPLLHFLTKVICGHASDSIRFIDDRTKIRVFNSLAFFGCAVSVIIICILKAENAISCLILLCVSTAFLGFTSGGFFKSASLIARHYTPFVTGNVSLAMSVMMLFVPFSVSFLAPDNTETQWNTVFYVSAIILIVAAVLFVVFCQAKPALWAISPASMKNIHLHTKVIRICDAENNHIPKYF